MNTGKYINNFNALELAMTKISDIRSKLSKTVFDDCGTSCDPEFMSLLDDLESIVCNYFNELKSVVVSLLTDTEIKNAISIIYDKMEDNSINVLGLELPDIPRIPAQYSSYLSGFSEFVKLVIGMRSGEIDREKIISKLNAIESNDIKYVDELFNQSVNDKYTTIFTGVTNIEYMSIFLNEMEGYVDEIKTLIQVLKEHLSDCNFDTLEMYMFKFRVSTSYIISIMRFHDALISYACYSLEATYHAVNNPLEYNIYDETRGILIKREKDEDELKIV